MICHASVAVCEIKSYGKTEADFEIVCFADLFAADAGGFFPKRVKIVLNIRGCVGRCGGRIVATVVSTFVLIAASDEREHQNQRKNHDEK